MRIFKDTLFYLHEYGFLNLLRKIPVKLDRSIRLAFRQAMNKYLPGKVRTGYAQLAPILIFTCPGLSPRVNLVLENGNNINAGMDRAIIFAVMAAIKWNYALRIIANPTLNINHFHGLLISTGIDFRNNAEIISCEPEVDNKEIDVCNGDIFVTTSWLTTHRVLGSINEKKVIYLVQEDERALCQDVNLKISCSEILRNEGIYFIVNSRKLYDYLLAEGFENIRARGTWIEGNLPADIAGGGKNISHEFNQVIQILDGFLIAERAYVPA